MSLAKGQDIFTRAYVMRCGKGHLAAARLGQSIGLKFRLAPSLMPDGQREVMVFVRV